MSLEEQKLIEEFKLSIKNKQKKLAAYMIAAKREKRSDLFFAIRSDYEDAAKRYEYLRQEMLKNGILVYR